MARILVVIPARGGSKGIPRKNLRKLLDRPLIAYSINVALRSKYDPDVYVSTDDEEIEDISKKYNACVLRRDSLNSQDNTTLDPVIYDAYLKISANKEKEYDLIVTLQPTSPLLKVESLDKAIEQIINNKNIDTIISATDDTHLTWKKVEKNYVPNYTERLNRQYLEPLYKETGGFMITRSSVISETSRIGKNVDLYLLTGSEAIDVDTYEDWSLCEYHLRHRKILFVVSGNKSIGLGHVYNCLLLANDILDHEVVFLVDNDSSLALEKIKEKNYPVYMQKSEDLIDDIRQISPDVIINDRLDTDTEYMKKLKELSSKIINFEDLGSGSSMADLVVNAMYPEKEIFPNHYYGHKYFVLRDEFILTPAKKVAKEVRNVLLSFGGVDPNNYTHKVVESIYQYCLSSNIHITIICGFGYQKIDTLKPYDEITIIENTMSIADIISKSDIVFTSAGRTTFETASLHVPAIVLAQNKREETHFFASEENGFVNLGLGKNVSKQHILQVFMDVAESYDTRKHMSNLMSSTSLKDGRKVVNSLIKSVIQSV